VTDDGTQNDLIEQYVMSFSLMAVTTGGERTGELALIQPIDFAGEILTENFDSKVQTSGFFSSPSLINAQVVSFIGVLAGNSSTISQQFLSHDDHN
jgi:hypothetical protein